ncbi:MAG: hypothetical protein LCH79_07875 [Proteobacteria bacterium]|nr:hypothetical protein [Pseudomonadota bacterium]
MKPAPTTEAVATVGAVDAAAAQAPAPSPAAAPAAVEKKPEPAFTPPPKNPPVPRDKFHGHGGMFALVNGKRVPIGDDGKPLPT